jgi:hypothetical protein
MAIYLLNVPAAMGRMNLAPVIHIIDSLGPGSYKLFTGRYGLPPAIDASIGTGHDLQQVQLSLSGL